MPGADLFGEPVLPTSRDKPSYGGFGASLLMYHVCACMNSVYFGAGLFALILDKSSSFEELKIERGQWGIAIAGFLLLTGFQICVRRRLIADKSKKGY